MAIRSDSSEALQEKLVALENILSEMDSVVVAYSGGADSALLSAVAHSTLGIRALSVTASSPSLAPSELTYATDVARQIGLHHRVLETMELEREDYRANGPDRCFFCKDELYSQLGRIAHNEGFSWVVNGANTDDLGDHRPGLDAAKRHNVRSPMVEAGLAKKEIRDISRGMGLVTWDKPAQACLSSRIPYGIPVSEETLNRIANAEGFLRSLGFSQLRVRHHDTIARIEVDSSEMDRFFEEQVRREITDHFRSIGYSYVALDLDGFRSGSLNEILPA